MKNNYAKNLAMLKKCRRIYNIIFWIYFLLCVPLAVITLIYGILSLATVNSNVIGFVMTFILLLALFATGLLSIYKKETKFTYLPLLPAVILVLVNCFSDMYFLNIITLDSMGPIHMVIAIASSLILTVTHRNYRWLEQQEGFPYFNVRFEENKNKLEEYKKNNPYQHYIDRYNNSSGKMDDI
ncbi:MAG: hypothetical protein NC177_08425 [Ruminococcus flavefaciens]|nr:hypothetical protein [Ruminococcus flavefaciens]